MKAEVWLKIEGKRSSYGTKAWSAGQVHAFKSKPNTRGNEIAIKLTLQIPDSVFAEPIFEAKLELPEGTKNFPDKVEVARHLSDAMSDRMGFRVKVDMNEGAVSQ